MSKYLPGFIIYLQCQFSGGSQYQRDGVLLTAAVLSVLLQNKDNTFQSWPRPCLQDHHMKVNHAIHITNVGERTNRTGITCLFVSFFDGLVYYW